MPATPTNDASLSDPNLELLRVVGRAVYGEFWQKPMAKTLGMSQRHINRWNRGVWLVPPVLPGGRALPVTLLELLDDHQAEIDRVRNLVYRALPEGGRPGT